VSVLCRDTKWSFYLPSINFYVGRITDGTVFHRENEREKDLVGAVTTWSTHRFHKVLLSEQTEWYCGVLHSDTPYLRQTFQLIFSIITEQTNSTGKHSLNLRKRVCTVTFFLSLMPLRYFQHLISSNDNRPASLTINLPTTPYPRSGGCNLFAGSEYGVQSELTFPYLQQP